MKYIIYDTETTHLDPQTAEIWQFSGLIMDFTTKEIREFNYKYKTNNEVSLGAREKCNITPEEIKTYEDFNIENITDSLCLDQPDVYYIGYNVKFDRNVIKNYLMRNKLLDSYPNINDDSKWIDVYRLAKRCYYGQPFTDIAGSDVVSLRLSFLFHYLHLYKDDEELNFHSADFDVKATWRLLKHICQEKNVDVQDGVKLNKIANSSIILERFGFGKYKGQKIADVYNKHTPETDRYFTWLCQSDVCDIDSPNYDPDLYYTLEKL